MTTTYEIHLVICELERDETGEVVDVIDSNEHTEIVSICYETYKQAEKMVDEMLKQAYGGKS